MIAITSQGWKTRRETRKWAKELRAIGFYAKPTPKKIGGYYRISIDYAKYIPVEKLRGVV
jgi:hypothetical protein